MPIENGCAKTISFYKFYIEFYYFLLNSYNQKIVLENHRTQLNRLDNFLIQEAVL